MMTTTTAGNGRPVKMNKIRFYSYKKFHKFTKTNFREHLSARNQNVFSLNRMHAEPILQTDVKM